MRERRARWLVGWRRRHTHALDLALHVDCEGDVLEFLVRRSHRAVYARLLRTGQRAVKVEGRLEVGREDRLVAVITHPSALMPARHIRGHLRRWRGPEEETRRHARAHVPVRALGADLEGKGPSWVVRALRDLRVHIRLRACGGSGRRGSSRRSGRGGETVEGEDGWRMEGEEHWPSMEQARGAGERSSSNPCSS